MFARSLTALPLLLGLLAPAGAIGHDPGAGNLNAQGEVRARVADALGGRVTPRADGLLKVRTAAGETLTTHGPDFRTDLTLDDHGGSIDAGDPQRAPSCVTNPTATDAYQEILYAYPATGSNLVATKRADIQGVMGRLDAVLNEESLASGGPTADYKVRCDSDGSVRVTAFSVPAVGETTFAQVVTAAQAAGFTNPRADYSIFYDGPGPSGVCGTGTMYNDESPGAGNASNNPGAPFSAGYAVSYGGCWFGRTPMHENGHNEGAVQAGAPDSTGTGGHCDEDWDVMCYLDGGNIRQDYPQPCSIAAGTLHFDCGWDSYFDSAPEPGEYLATHWNIGSSANRFIRFGGPSADFSSSCVLLHCTFTDHSSAPTGISSRTWNFGDGSTLTSTATTVTHDYLAVGGYPVTLTVVDGGGASSSTTRAVALNDAFANAQQLTGVAQTVTGGNLGATKEAGEPNHAGNAGGASVWYRWTPAVPGPTTIDTCGADFDTTLGVYTGSSVGALTQVAASDDNAAVCGTNAAQSAATFTAHAGTAYRIAVDGWDGASGSIALRLSETVDTTGPVATITGEPDDFGANPSFSFGAGEPATFECRLDGAPFAPCVSPQSYSGLADGPHVFSVRAIDAVGNAGAPVDRSFTVDSSAPETTIDSGPSKVKAGRSATFTFSSSEPGSSFECRLDSGRSGPCASPATIPRPRPGVHTFQVAAVDQAGHVDRTPATRTFKVKKRRRR